MRHIAIKYPEAHEAHQKYQGIRAEPAPVFNHPRPKLDPIFVDHVLPLHPLLGALTIPERCAPTPDYAIRLVRIYGNRTNERTRGDQVIELLPHSIVSTFLSCFILLPLLMDGLRRSEGRVGPP